MEKRLYRIKNSQTMLGGVSQGLGQYFNLDPVLFRFLFVILFCTPFPAFFIYIILWIFLPEKAESAYFATDSTNFQTSNFTNMSHQSKNGSLVGGSILIILGVIFSIQQFTEIHIWEWVGKLWPLILIFLGVWIIVKDRDGDNKNRSHNSDNF
jgi:phage shock protein C